MQDGLVTVTPAGSQKTGALKSMIKANCFIYLADDQAAPEDGELIPVVPFGDLLDHPFLENRLNRLRRRNLEAGVLLN